MNAAFWIIAGGIAWTPVAIAIAARVLPAAPPRDLDRTAGARAIVGAALGIGLLALGFWASADLAATPRAVALLVVHGALAIFLAAYAKSVDPGRSILGIPGARAAGFVLRAIVVYAGFVPVVVAAHVLNARLVGNEVDVVHRTLHDLLSEGGIARAALVANVVVAVPLFEELTFRGLLQQGLAAQLWPGVARHAAPLAIGLASLAFTGLHDPATYVPVLVLSLMLGGAFHRAGTIVVPVTMHAVHNLAVVVMGVVSDAGSGAS